MSAAFWDKRSKKYDDGVKKDDALYKNTIASTRALLGGSDVVLDFACASGEMSLDIASRVQSVHGIDTSAKMIELANEKLHHRHNGKVVFNQMDAFDPGLEHQSFSAITAFNIFHLLDDAPGVLARLNDLMTTGGLLITKTPCLNEWSWLPRSMVRLAQKLGIAPHIRGFTFAELELLVASGDFEIMESKIWDAKSAVQWIVAKKSRGSVESRLFIDN